MFHVKICGITRAEDAQAAAAAGADAIGLNFYPQSSRYIERERAEQIVAALAPGIVKVGVFVNESSGRIREIAQHLALDAVQLHGDEPAEMLAELDGLAVIKAVRIADSLAPLVQFWSAARNAPAVPRMLLVDSRHGQSYGGTGRVGRWDVLAARERDQDWPPLVLAGGLTADNVAEAIAQVQPDAVDTASGVESSPGIKDEALVQAFVAQSRRAFGLTG